MARVFIPSLLRDLTGGQESVQIPAATVAEVIDRLEADYPGVKARLLDGDRVRPNISVVVDGEITRQRLRHKLNPDSEVHFLPALSGG